MDYRRVKLDGGIYFFTVVTHARLPLFGVPENVELLKRAMSQGTASLCHAGIRDSARSPALHVEITGE